MAFQLVTILNHLSEPFTVGLILLTAGCALTWSGRRQRAGRALTLCATTWLLLLAYGVPFRLLAQRLENEYQPIVDASTVSKVRWIVVLGGGHTSAADLPAASQASDATLHRVTEAVRLHRMIPGSRILFSGGATLDSVADARVNGAAALDMGVAPADISLSTQARTTAEEMTCIGQVVGTEPFVMVTTAMHMPRAMMLAESHGLYALASPADFRARSARSRLLQLFPMAGGPLLASAVFHEAVGLTWLRLQRAMGRPLVPSGPCTAPSGTRQ